MFWWTRPATDRKTETADQNSGLVVFHSRNWLPGRPRRRKVWESSSIGGEQPIRYRQLWTAQPTMASSPSPPHPLPLFCGQLLAGFKALDDAGICGAHVTAHQVLIQRHDSSGDIFWADALRIAPVGSHAVAQVSIHRHPRVIVVCTRDSTSVLRQAHGPQHSVVTISHIICGEARLSRQSSAGGQKTALASSGGTDGVLQAC